MAAILDFWRGMTGAVLPFAGTVAPQGWVLASGAAVSRETYSALFAVIGTTYGPGDGSTTFNLPDLRGRGVAGVDNMGGTAAGRLTTAAGGINAVSLGAAGGSQSHTLTIAQIPQHNHAPPPGLSHFLTLVNGNPAKDMGNTTGADYDWTTSSVTDWTGGGSAHPIVQPTMALNYIIKT